MPIWSTRSPPEFGTALVANDGELLGRYKTNRNARLITFMRMRASSEIVRYIRSEVRHRKRELAALRQRVQHQGQDGAQPVNVLAEFFGTLDSGEQVFCSEHLLGEPSGARAGILRVEYLATEPSHSPQVAPLRAGDVTVDQSPVLRSACRRGPSLPGDL